MARPTKGKRGNVIHNLLLKNGDLSGPVRELSPHLTRRQMDTPPIDH
jgi:hypothetical protein